MEEKPDYLDVRRSELLEEYQRTFVPKIEAANKRRMAMRRVAREVAVQALATTIGGAILAGGAVALGWLGSDTTMRQYAAGGAALLVVLLVLTVITAAKPLDTRDDHELIAQLRQVDALIDERDSRPAAEPSDEDST